MHIGQRVAENGESEGDSAGNPSSLMSVEVRAEGCLEIDCDASASRTQFISKAHPVRVDNTRRETSTNVGFHRLCSRGLA